MKRFFVGIKLELTQLNIQDFIPFAHTIFVNLDAKMKIPFSTLLLRKLLETLALHAIQE